jgi:predicted dehydrogenase
MNAGPQFVAATYRAALIGCGSMGSYVMDELVGHRGRILLPYGHAEVLKTHPRLDLVAGADPDPRRREDFARRWAVPRVYADHRDMLERERPLVVSIASPPTLHAQHVIDCAERGVRGIFCEKPLAPTLREADSMLAACENHGTALAINHTRRGDPFVHAARRLITDGEIGQVLTISATWAGRLFLSGTHSFDLVNYFNGDRPTIWLVGHAEEPSAEMKVIPTQRGEDVGGTAYAVYDNGVRAFFNGRDGNAAFRFEIFGTGGYILVDDQDAGLWRQDKTGPFRGLLKCPFPQMMRYTAPMVFLVDDLLAAMETGREPLSSGRTALHALSQILATHFSSENDNQKVMFPFTELDWRAPFRWFGAGGSVLYHAPNPGARD